MRSGMSTEDDSQDAGQWLEPLSDVAEKKKVLSADMGLECL